MALTLNINTPAHAGSLGSGTVQVQVIRDGITIQDRTLYFNVTEFCAITDSVAPNLAQLHFGDHYVSVDGSYYTYFTYNNIAEANASALAAAVAQDVIDNF